MSDLNGAALMLGGLMLVWALGMFAFWWMRRPRPDPAAYAAPAAPREIRIPKLTRKAEPEAAPIEISASRLARISGKTTPDKFDDALSFYESETDAPSALPPIRDEPPVVVELDSAAPQDSTPVEAVHETAPVSENPPVVTMPEPAIAAPALDEELLESLAADVERRARIADVPLADTPFSEAPPASAVIDKSVNGVVAYLVPQTPPRDAIFRKSWLGGRPHLPADIAWPRVDGSDADFLAQIACTDLPSALWDGLGPRTGSLAFFANPDTGAVAALHLIDEGEPREPSRPVGGAYFHPYGIDSADLMSLTIRAFPEWPVDVVIVEPGDAGPRQAEASDVAAQLAADYDIADPAFHPFDWASMLALADILESRLAQQPLGGPAPDDASDELAQAMVDADDANRDAVQRAAEIITIIREGSEQGAGFSPPDATAVMAGLHAIRWARVWAVADEESGEDRVETLVLPLTRHRPDGDLWVDAYRTVLFDHAKHAWCRNPGILSAPARAFFEPLWEAMAISEIPSMGNFPSLHAVGFDDERDVVMLEFPAGGLMSRGVREGGNLVLAMRKADLAAGDFSAMRALRSN